MDWNYNCSTRSCSWYWTYHYNLLKNEVEWVTIQNCLASCDTLELPPQKYKDYIISLYVFLYKTFEIKVKWFCFSGVVLYYTIFHVR